MSTYVGLDGKIGDGRSAVAATKGRRVPVRIGRTGFTRRLTVRTQRASLLRGKSIGCGKDPKAGTALFNLTLTPLIEPADYFLSASSGPRVEGLLWSGWGTSKATASGRYISDCASCGDPEDLRSRVVLSEPVRCSIYGVKVYRRGVLEKLTPAGEVSSSQKIPTGYPCGAW